MTVFERAPRRDASATASPVRIERRGRSFRLSVERVVEADQEHVFAFFAEPRNLERITPPWLGFRIVGEPPIMRRGALIDYRLRLHGIPLRWRTEITDWSPPHRFVDVQRRGPFALWEHRHDFEATTGGTLMRDTVDYSMALPHVSNRLVVARDLRAIFEYRHAVIPELVAAKARGPGMQQPDPAGRAQRVGEAAAASRSVASGAPSWSSPGTAWGRISPGAILLDHRRHPPSTRDETTETIPRSERR